MALTVADSDVLIDALNGREPSAERVRKELMAGSLATTTISVFELLSGVDDADDRDRVRALLLPVQVFSFDVAAARAAARVRRDLERNGIPIQMADSMIAGICMSASATLLTRNRAHFERVAGLHIESP